MNTDSLYICETCQKKFNSKSNLNQHLKRKTPCKPINNNKNNKLQCDVCFKTFTDKRNLVYHKTIAKPCKPVIENLQNQIATLKNQIITTNNNQKTINNNQKTKTNNNQYNIYINSTELATNNNNVTHDLNTFNYKQIERIIDHINVREHQQMQLLNIDKDHNKDFILDNTEEIGELFKILYTDFKNMPCIIFRLDEINFNDIYVKSDDSLINKLDNSILLYIIYQSFSILIEKYADCINKRLKIYYKNFIDEYKSGLFNNLNKPHVKKFIVEIKNKLKDNLTSLYEDLTFLYKKNIKKLNDKDSKYTEYLKNKNIETIEANIIDRKVKYIKSDDLQKLNETLQRLLSYDKINIARKTTIDRYNYYVLAIFEFFLTKFYFQHGDYMSVKMEKNKLYKYNKENNIWEAYDYYLLFDDIIEELSARCISYNHKSKSFISDKQINYDSLKEDIENDLFIWPIIMYLFKYKVFEEYSNTTTTLTLV